MTSLLSSSALVTIESDVLLSTAAAIASSDAENFDCRC